MQFQNGTLQEELFGENATVESFMDPAVMFGPQRDSLYIVIPITIMYTIIFVTGLLGNIFTCIVITRNKSMHTATNYYLFSLAVSDLLLLVSGMPQEMYLMWSKWPYVFGPAFCLIRGLAAETSTNASVLTITLFTVERYLAICHPFQSYKMSTLSRALKHIVLLWIFALATALPQALQFGIKKFGDVTMCWQTRVIIEHSFEISTFLFFFSPMVVITMLYLLIGMKLNKTSQSRMNKDMNMDNVTGNHRVSRKHSQSTKRVVKMLVAVVVTFFVCWAPFHAQRLVAIYGAPDSHSGLSEVLLFVYHIVTYISGVFYYLSTCINPILYNIMSNKFRDAFKNTMLSCCTSRGTQGPLYSAMAFARPPTLSGSDHSGNNNSSQDQHKQRKKSTSTKVDIEETSRFSRSYRKQSSWSSTHSDFRVKNCNGWKGGTAEASPINEKCFERDISRFIDSPISQPESISNSSLKETKLESDNEDIVKRLENASQQNRKDRI